jgi:FMN phosphatase YigB (HAD superfamily)
VADIEAVIFDLGRVLVGWDISEGLWAELREVFGPPGAREPGGAGWEKLYDGYSRGKVPPRDFHREFCRLSGFDLDWETFVARWCDIFYTMDGMERLLADVRERVAVGLLSDTDPLHWAFVLEHYPWLRQIGKPALSFETGARKPEREAYLAAAGNLGRAPGACFFIDDLEANVLGAREAGMDAVQYVDEGELRRTLTSRGVLG